MYSSNNRRCFGIYTVATLAFFYSPASPPPPKKKIPFFYFLQYLFLEKTKNVNRRSGAGCERGIQEIRLWKHYFKSRVEHLMTERCLMNTKPTAWWWNSFFVHLFLEKTLTRGFTAAQLAPRRSEEFCTGFMKRFSP